MRLWISAVAGIVTLILVDPVFAQTEIKLGHVGEYFILAGLVYRALKFEHPSLTDATFRAVVFVVLAALLDEFHQAFVSSRTASMIDVGYDCLGGAWALWIIASYELRRLRPHPVL